MFKKKKTKTQHQEMPEQGANVRRHNFEEVPLGYSSEQAKIEASRCLQCKKPSCIDGCPVGINIPSFIKFIYEEKFTQAIFTLLEKNSLPAICGRVCPQINQCQKKCIVGKKDNPISIGNLERFIADWARNRPDIPTPYIASKTGKKVAVIGSGPGGLTVAGDLIRKGHDITIFEAFHKPGGVLVYGIPEFRLPKKIVADEINSLKKLGIKIKNNIVVGKSITIDELFTKNHFDAIYIGVGAGLPSFLNITGENLIGVYSANEYLTRSNLMRAYLFPKYDTPLVKGKHVVVFGGGNVAVDSLRTAIRMGSNNVKCIYRRSRNEMPARIEEIHHAEEENIEFLYLHTPLRFLGNNKGWLKAVELQKMRLGEPDISGRRRPEPITNSTKIIPCDLAIIAVGSGANPLITMTTPGLETNKFGYIKTNANGKTKKFRVWAGGDIVTGAATVILAAGAGRIAANSIHKYLSRGW